LGVKLDPNFDRPFVSSSVTEFWRRWHMTLAFWLRDYLYLPLVLRLRSFGRSGIVAVMIFTFAICGVWHAATWNFLLFGVAQGVALTLEFLTKSWRTKTLKPVPARWVTRAGVVYTFSFFVLSQVLFKSPTISAALDIYRHLLAFRLPHGVNSLLGMAPLLFAFQVLALLAWGLVEWSGDRAQDRHTPWYVLLCATLILFLGCLSSGHFIYAAF
jgi:D-alanyl-lipoteichoic acid acyltransferase DltB (MBOAT superfamily)